jgi:hypothetical protein
MASGLSVLFQVIMVFLMAMNDGNYRSAFGNHLILFVLCGAALLCALDGIRAGMSQWQRIIAGVVALFPVLFFAAMMYGLIRNLFVS